MKESIGVSFIINIVVLFIIIIFVFIAGTISYNKAFKVNSKIVNALEKFEGYNSASKEEMDLLLMSIGYKPGDSTKCPQTKNGGILVTASSFEVNPSYEKYSYCIYFFDNDGDDHHYTFGVTSYMDLDIPIVSNFITIPIYSKTRRIWRFNIEDQYPEYYYGY